MEQLDMFGGAVDVTPAPRPAVKPAADPDPQLSLFAVDVGNYVGQSVGVDAGFTAIADADELVAGDGLLTW